MIKLKTLLTEIALAKQTPVDNYLRQEMAKAIGVPPKYTGGKEDRKAFGEYLEQLEVWAKQHIPEHGVLLDIPDKKLYTADAKTAKMQGIYHFDDEYESFEDFVEDHFEPPDKVLIYSSQLARYVFGDDIATRIVIPGRNNS
jgi:hypothetical protein